MNGFARLCSAAAAVACLSMVAWAPAGAEGLEVAPTNIQLAPGQSAVALTITNRNDRKVSFQIRGFSWGQQGAEEDSLTPTDAILASPPIATIEPGATQVVRLVLKHPPEDHEEAYRILFDQLPPPDEAGVVHLLIRISIPVFAEPPTRVAPRVHWRIAQAGGRSWLVATNDGTRHLTVHDIKLQSADGHALGVEIKSPPHILAGASRRWLIVTKDLLAPNQVVRLTAGADSGAIDERVSPDSSP
jgi:fimbrial chaperone protein